MPTLCSNPSPQYSSSQRNFKLFGVTLNLVPGCDDHNAALSSSSSSSCLKGFSVGKNLGLITPSSSSSSISELHHHSDPPEGGGDEEEEEADAGQGLLVPVYHQAYISDALLVQGSSTSLRDRKKGVPWSEDEHRMFLIGLEKLGKGDWRGISRNFVISRTPTQVASHAQKYFLRQSNLNKKKRRSSLFDIISSPLPHMDHCHQRDFDLPTSVKLARDLLIPHHHNDLPPIKATNKNATPTSPCLLTRQPSKTLSHAHHLLFTGHGAKTALERRQIVASSSLCSSPSSSTSSISRTDEMVELSSLNLSIGPPSRPSYVPLFGS